jgi:hypothetical protein
MIIKFSQINSQTTLEEIYKYPKTAKMFKLRKT